MSKVDLISQHILNQYELTRISTRFNRQITFYEHSFLLPLMKEFWVEPLPAEVWLFKSPKMSFSDQQCKQPCVPPPCPQKTQEKCETQAEEVCVPSCQDPCQDKCPLQAQEACNPQFQEINQGNCPQQGQDPCLPPSQDQCLPQHAESCQELAQTKCVEEFPQQVQEKCSSQGKGK
ncbi:proline-rich protein 9 [Sigmodon hispidus]